MMQDYQYISPKLFSFVNILQTVIHCLYNAITGSCLEGYTVMVLRNTTWTWSLFPEKLSIAQYSTLILIGANLYHVTGNQSEHRSTVCRG